MDDLYSINALRLVQSADEIKSKLVGQMSCVHGLSVNEFFLLMHLDRAPGNRLTRVELARRMHMNASSVTRMAAPMEKIGLLARQVGKRDARKAFVVLTKAGQTKLNEARATFAAQAESVFSDRWDKADLDRLSKLLFRLVAGREANLT